MNTSERIDTDTQSSDLYLNYFPAFFVAVIVILGTIFYTQQDRDLRERETETASHAVLMGLRLNIERRLEHNFYVLEKAAEAISGRDPTQIEQPQNVGQTLLALSPDFSEVAIVQNGIVVKNFSKQEQKNFSAGVSFADWKTGHTLAIRGNLRGETSSHNTLLQINGRRFLVSEAAVGTAGTTQIASLIDIDEVLVRSGLFQNEGHTFTVKDMESGTYIFGSAQIDMHNALAETVIIGNLRWLLKSSRTGTASSFEMIRAIASYFVVGLLGLLIIGPTTWAYHLLRIKHQSQIEDRKQQRRLVELSTRLGIALEASLIGISEVDASAGKVNWDARTSELYGLPRTETETTLRGWWKTIHPKDRGRAIKDFRTALKGNRRVETEFRIRLPDHSERHVRSIWSATGTKNGRLLLNAQWDVTGENKRTEELIHAHRVAVKRNKELLRAKDQLEYMALHDPMTALPNRRYFDDYVAALGAPQTTGKRVIGILQIDLDSFKQVNDSHGHAAGDKVLAHAARAIDRCTRDGDFVARTGGDEFVLFCWRDVGGPAQIEAELSKLAMRIISAVQQPMIIKGKIYKPAVSIGIAPITSSATSWEGSLAQADAALYQAKDIGRNRHAFHRGRDSKEHTGVVRGSEDILSGIEKSQFHPVYQPQFRASDQSLVGIEALARWHHPIRGILTPETFLPAAKHLKLEAEIDAQIMDQTLRDIEAWKKLGLEVPRVAVNISPRRLCSDTLVDELKQTDIPDGALSFELLESIFVGEDDAHLISNVEGIKKLGIAIEIDDFGTGFASIVSLLRLEPNRLKIDRSLVAPVLDNQANRQVVRSIVEMARALDIQVLAEGVENPLQARVLRTLGCDALQGFGLGKPMPMSQMTRMLANSQERPTASIVEM